MDEARAEPQLVLADLSADDEDEEPVSKDPALSGVAYAAIVSD